VAEPGRTGEFELIRRHFAPLARNAPLAFDLTDDAALLRPAAGTDIVLTADAMVADVHFLAADPPDLVARKLLRVNLSDLAAMGARPLGYLLTAAWPRGTGEAWIASFAQGLAADQASFGLSLLGGDTVATPGPLTLSLTALGEVPAGRCLRRSGARPGDDVYVSGTLGDGALGLGVLQGTRPGLGAADAAFLADRYRLPQPRLDLGWRLLGHATAAMDVSDGLLGDLDHIAEASGVRIEIEAAALPLSAAARAALAADAAAFDPVLGGGDDYELVFLAPPGAAAAVAQAAAAANVPVARIGRAVAGTGVAALDAEGRALTPGRAGFRHF